MPPSASQRPGSGRGGMTRGIAKTSNYMTRDSARRLRLAKRAAKTILSSGGSIEAAATAAQAHGESPG